jgi:hypothetical protein
MMDAVVFAIAGVVLGALSSGLGVIWSAIKSIRRKKNTEQREQHEQHGQIDVELSGGGSISINISSATPEELVSFIDKIKEENEDAAGKPDRLPES